MITGTKRDLRQMVAEGKFREDLFYRLNVLPIVLPPLRERREDIPQLIDHFFAKFSRARGIDVPEISPAVRYAFSRYRWPGNVRELENACEQSIQICTCGTVRTGCVAASVLFGAQAPGPPSRRSSRRRCSPTRRSRFPSTTGCARSRRI